MKIEFEIECNGTQPGDCVGVVGQCNELGAWNTANALRLDGSAFPVWRGSVHLPPTAKLEYKYVILLRNGGCAWEPLDGNRVGCVDVDASGTRLWRDGKFGERALPTTNVHDFIARPETVCPSTTADSPTATQLSSTSTEACELRLVVKCSDTKPGDCVAVVGSWDWASPPRQLDGSAFPLWSGMVPRTPAIPLEYKYLLLLGDGTKCWEAREGNRVIQPSESSGEIGDGTPQFQRHCKSQDGRSQRSNAGRPKHSGSLIGAGNGSSIITGEKQTVYGRVCLDYGTLEQRMAKRMDQPVALNGDHDEQEASHGRSAPRAHLESDWAVLERALAARAAAWPEEAPHAMPPSTSITDDSASEFRDIVAFEGRGAVTLCERFKLARDLLERAPEGSAVTWTVLVWLRFSAARQLTWQRKSNTRPYLLSEATEALSQLAARRFLERPSERLLWRLMLAAVPRGGSGDQGQAIRDDILKIMGRWQLKKRKGDFMEQWHQKLHNNTTPDDVHICEAYLLFLRSNGDLEQFYAHLAEHGIDRERLQTFERPILQEPVFFPSIRNGLINDFERYLVVLKNVHAGADLEKSVNEVAQHGMDDKVRGVLEAILAERGASGDRIVTILAAVAEARASQPTDRSRLYLDLALESHSRLLAERLGGGLGLRGSALCTALLLEGLCRSVGGPDVRAAFRDFAVCLGSNGGEYEALRASAAAERARGSMASAGNVFAALQPRAEELGAALCKVTPEELPEPWAITLFAEEYVRGGPGFGPSLMLSAYERRHRQDMGGSAWQFVSMCAAQSGTLHVIPSLKGDLKFEPPSIILTEVLSGEEDPPEGTVAVLTPNAVDVLSHVAVRARTMGIFLATCFDQEVLEELRKLHGRGIRVGAKAGTVLFEEVDSAQLSAKQVGPNAARTPVVVVRPPPSTELWVTEECLGACPQAGAKSKNLSALRASLPRWVRQPRSAVVPFGVLSRVLAAPENSLSQAKHLDLEAQLEGSQAVEPLLHELRTVIKTLKPPGSLLPALKAAVEAHCPGSGGSAWWEALAAVWASSWSERAFHACKRAGIRTTDVAMAVLVQQLVPAEYSFVVHTRHPTGSPDDMYAEVVVGLGEVLVGNYTGRALSFTAPRDGSGPPKVGTLPSKGSALFGSGLIFRSDSNAEDLENFAGAGLFDSVPVRQQEVRIVEYRGEKLIEDRTFQATLLDGIAKLALAVEASAGGGPQDIEGCYAKGEFYVVQTRPQA